MICLTRSIELLTSEINGSSGSRIGGYRHNSEDLEERFIIWMSK